MNLWSFRPWSTTGVKICTSGWELLDEGDPLGRGDDADHPRVLCADLAQHVERDHGAAAGRQHRVDHQDEAAVQILRQL